MRYAEWLDEHFKDLGYAPWEAEALGAEAKYALYVEFCEEHGFVPTK